MGRAGIFAAFCRHGKLLLALNMWTGERWAYAVLLLFVFMKANIVPAVFW